MSEYICNVNCQNILICANIMYISIYVNFQNILFCANKTKKRMIININVRIFIYVRIYI